MLNELDLLAVPCWESTNPAPRQILKVFSAKGSQDKMMGKKWHMKS
jgi:hypothetical protein